MIIIKNKRSIDYMRKAGKSLAEVFVQFQSSRLLQIGVSTHAIDQWFEKEMRFQGLKPECKGYAGYKHATCISVNDVIVHGVPSEHIVLSDGDMVTIDVVGSHKGYCADMARSFLIGNASKVASSLIDTAQRALDKAIQKVTPGILLSEVIYEIQTTVESEGFGIVRQFAGHGIGRSLHEEPDVPNYVDEESSKIILREGMAIAIEPMITEGSYDVKIMPDGWTAKTVDGKLAAHVEDTILITATGCEVLTRL
ncbi:type I methionyl aminopeptidase [Candidatus Babeliales bacterium]|nr:type I methionyl aminopeptidase [Candidatus Babeliales bacterium]